MNYANGYADAIEQAALDAVDYGAPKKLIALIRSLRAPITASNAPSGAIAEIATERQRQINVEGFTEEHDDEHSDGALAMAAACYATPLPVMEDFPNGEQSPEGWPWPARWWKPRSLREDLIRAGALIVAEIERLDRAGLRLQSSLLGAPHQHAPDLAREYLDEQVAKEIQRYRDLLGESAIPTAPGAQS